MRLSAAGGEGGRKEPHSLVSARGVLVDAHGETLPLPLPRLPYSQTMDMRLSLGQWDLRESF